MQNYDDMCLMSYLTEQNILNNLVLRYQQDQIYTSIGPTLISLNPYKIIPALYNPEVVQQVKDVVLSGNSLKKPHIYAVAGRAFQGMINKIEKQAIIISGESGAGKTQSTKYCMQMLTSLSQFEEQQHPISNKILACNPILQAFGNSKTVRNENSSRFGKYVQIYFGPDHTIKGANIKSYLLQKSRVTNVAPKERSFHIFYALCASKISGAKEASAYNFLNQSNCFTASGINDQQLFEKVAASLNQLGFTEGQQQRIWKLLITILELGNLKFDDSERQKNESLPCNIIKESEVIPQISEVLGLPSEDFKKMLLFNTIQIPRQEPIFKPMDKHDCKANLHTLCKAVYNSLFEWILSKLEAILNPPLDLEDVYRNIRSSMKAPLQQLPIARFQINILDIFGFENFDENSLEQLCINYTNQKLLDLYNRCVFDNQLAILREDGLENQIDNIQPPTNDASVSLLDAIFRTIKDNTRIKHLKDQDIVAEFKANRINSGHIRNITYDKFNQNIFVVQHSPCQVAYNVAGFKLKNQDKLTTQIESITVNLFNNQKLAATGKTLLQKFTTEINSLTNQLETAANHYVRCLKPNQQKKNEVVSQFILRQIKYMGVFETIQIRKKIFPYRKSYEEMAYLFEPIFKQSKGKAPRAAVDIILAQIKAKPMNYLLGVRRIYMSEALEQQINKKLIQFDKIRIEKANIIKRHFKRMKYRQNFRNCVYQVIDRIKVLKKWGNQVQKLMFCCFREIADRSESVRQKQIEESHMELRQSLVQIQQLQNQQIHEEMWFLRSSCRLINESPDNNLQQRNEDIDHQSPQKIISLSNTYSPDFKNSKKPNLIHELQHKNSQLQSQISQLNKKQSQLQSNLHQAHEKINNQKLIIDQFEEATKNKQEQCNYLKDQLNNKQQQCEQLTLKLKQAENKIKEAQDHHSPTAIKERVQKINELRQPQADPLQWQSVQAELKSLQNQHEKKQKELQTVNRQSSSKQRQLEVMIKELESIVDTHKNKSGSLQTKVEDLNQKLYKKCLDYEDLLKKHHEEQKRVQEYRNFEKMKNIDKSTIQKLRASLSLLEKENKDLKDRVDQLINQSHQYRKVVEGLKANLAEGSRINFDSKNSSQSGQVRTVSEQQLFNYIHAYKVGRSQTQLRTLKQKICYILP